MSVRAYRIISREIEKSPAFNLWNHEKFMDYLRDNDCLGQLNDSGGGAIEIPIDVYKKGLKYLPKDERDQALLDIKACEEEGYVEYTCF